MLKLIPLLFLLAGCTNAKVYLKNEKTGQIVTCGTVHPITLAESGLARRDSQCIEDYKAQGFIRVPGPDSK